MEMVQSNNLLDSLFNLYIPVLTGEDLFFVPPGIYLGLRIQVLMKLLYGWFIAGGMADKNMKFSILFGHAIPSSHSDE
jgi:hypothetical protein